MGDKMQKDLEQKSQQYVDYSLCMGFKNNKGKTIVEPHKYEDGEIHPNIGSHGLCPDCKALYYAELENLGE